MTPSEMAVNKGLELLSTAASLATSEAPKLLSEYLNFLMFASIVDLIQILAWGLIPYVIAKALTRYITTQQVIMDANPAKEGETCLKKINVEGVVAKGRKETAEIARFVLTTGTIIGLATCSFGTIKNIGKILIAPKVFLIEEGAHLLKKAETAKQ